MARLKTDPIGQADLIEFLDASSDFAFEIGVIKTLSGLGFVCEHGGTYIDAATKKPRQFDIRATRTFDNHIIRLAVECKNLREHFPLLISCLPRTVDESFHDVAVSVDRNQMSLLPKTGKSGVYYRAMEPYAKMVRLRDSDSIYKSSEFVGKASDQIGRDSSDAIVANDSDVYGKWSQAIASAEDLTVRACYDGDRGDRPAYFSFVLPILVVPNGRLWQTHFDNDGNRILDPQQVDRVPFFVNRSYLAGDAMQGTHYRISHLEFVTQTGLQSLVMGFADNLQVLFPGETIVNRITEYLESGEDSDGAI